MEDVSHGTELRVTRPCGTWRGRVYLPEWVILLAAKCVLVCKALFPFITFFRFNLKQINKLCDVSIWTFKNQWMYRWISQLGLKHASVRGASHAATLVWHENISSGRKVQLRSFLFSQTRHMAACQLKWKHLLAFYVHVGSDDVIAVMAGKQDGYGKHEAFSRSGGVQEHGAAGNSWQSLYGWFHLCEQKKKNIYRSKDSDQTVFMVKNTDALCLKEIKNDYTLIQTHSFLLLRKTLLLFSSCHILLDKQALPAVPEEFC